MVTRRFDIPILCMSVLIHIYVYIFSSIYIYIYVTCLYIFASLYIYLCISGHAGTFRVPVFSHVTLIVFFDKCINTPPKKNKLHVEPENHSV